MKSISACLVLGFLFLGLAGCGGTSDIDQDVVTNLSDGTATGTGFSGTYKVSLYVSACSGTCPVVTSGLVSISTCDVGFKSSTHLTAVQTDGHLQVDSTGLLVNRMTGGINGDGSFDVGGFGTQSSGSMKITTRAQGTLKQDGTIVATDRSHGWGTINNVPVDCYATYELTGAIRR